ncbi:TIR domain-containing protein [Gilvimarinus algae]|uniref:TIR domain-containing protein n=1 Tax=Gilvimarinus algae TaxID=3058037 RepID=A0ABT8TD88_9GAMM|nr:TIR domain-containing protein [Gilvimarinus sp. SDUM040014]MDO3381519.1 TIR domain-containing protein [Gilvimarinus sp. SDUM040014]
MKVFISHSSKNKPEVRKLARSLRAKGISVWLDEEQIKVGESISKKIQEGLKESEYLCLWVTVDSIESGWVEKEWLPKIKQEVDEKRTVVLPLLAEDAVMPEFLADKKYADFRNSFQHGLNDLLQVFNIIPSHKKDGKVKNYTKELLVDLENAVIPLPHLTTINIAKSLKKIPRSGKKIRLDTFTPELEMRSIYDHILSVAHSADHLLPEIGVNLTDTEALDISRCIVFHDVCEIFLGDIPQFTALNDAKRSKASILAAEKLGRFDQWQRDKTTNQFIKLFLENKMISSLNRYEEIVEENGQLFKTFALLDKIDPIIGVWRYLHSYRGRLGDGANFVSRLRDFFIYERPVKMVQEFSGDESLLSFVNTLRNRSEALHYYKTGNLTSEEMFGINPEVLKTIIEEHEMRYVPRVKKKKHNKSIQPTANASAD